MSPFAASDAKQATIMEQPTLTLSLAERIEQQRETITALSDRSNAIMEELADLVAREMTLQVALQEEMKEIAERRESLRVEFFDVRSAPAKEELEKLERQLKREQKSEKRR